MNRRYFVSKQKRSAMYETNHLNSSVGHGKRRLSNSLALHIVWNLVVGQRAEGLFRGP